MTDHPIALNLAGLERISEERIEALVSLSDRLLNILSQNALVGGELQTGRFRQELSEFRLAIADAEDPSELRRLSDQCIKVCEDFFARCSDYLAGRDSELHELIELLRNALERIAGDAQGIDAKLENSSQRLKRLSTVDDIRQLRLELSGVIEDLQQAVAEKKRCDQAQLEHLSQQIAALESKVESTVADALRDPLTGVSNRRRFDQVIKRYMASREGRQAVLAMIDLNKFKQINDTHGHAVGDRVLTIAARCLSKAIRSTDLLARYGGDEFVVIFRDMSADLARQRLDEVMRKITASRYEYQGVGRRVVVSFTASYGLAELQAGDTPDDLISRADQELYVVKNGGNSGKLAEPSPVAVAASA